MRNTELTGKVAMITGGGSGIGRATALLMASSGATVVVSDVNVASATRVAQEIRTAGGMSYHNQCDIGVEVQIRDAIAEVVDRYGRIDILHNNAALLSPQVIADDLDIGSMTSELWDKVMTVTVRGTMLGCRFAVNAMMKTGGGSIVNTSSNYGLTAFNRMPAYSTSKAAINMITQSVATRYGRDGIRCNAVAPAMVHTPLLAQAIPAELIRLNEDSTVDGKLCQPEEVAEVVTFLASPAASAITGQIICVDHGMSAHLATYSDARKFFGDI
jgi:NAD(P)-dependent dehydrogenase (short-subunit alcohol dehydrogenase family)